MNVHIIQVPYDCGYKEVRQGLAPAYYLKNNLVKILEDDGHCICCLGNIAGIGSESLGVVWFDAHGEFNTPETTLSGFLDGMPLATATGRCWKAVANTIPGFAPVADSNVILVGATDLDISERQQLELSDINLVGSRGRDERAILEAIEAALKGMQDRVTGIYVHIDMDAFELNEGTANHYGATGGLTAELIEKAIALVKDHFTIKSATIASFDPVGDTNGEFLAAGLRCARKLALNI